MIPVNAPRIFLSSATLLAMAFSAHANPRGVDSQSKSEGVDASPLAIELPADMLSSDTLHVESAPAINIEEIAVFDMPADGHESMPGDSGIDDMPHDRGTIETQQHLPSDAELEAEALDLELELDRELHDDEHGFEMRPQIELDIPAPVISLDF